MNKFYATTAIPYVNAKPHIGHALEYVIADSIVRTRKIIGDDVFFVSGADENAVKNVLSAEKEGLEPARFLDKYSKIFEEFYKLLGVELDEFRRGTDSGKHWPGVQKLWRLANNNGDIYKKKYSGLYCVGCESFKVEKDLVNGKCPDHNTKPELVEEENYFFRLSKYQVHLEKLISSDELLIRPEKRKNEVLSFIRSGLEDFSISRSNKRARDIGVPVPGDDSQKMYVWFDALTIYMTAIGWGYDPKLWEKYWPADLHVIGKDITRFHAIYWPAMLMSARLPLPKTLLVHGFITSGGVKMSKTIGNVIDPYEVIKKYGVDALRYYLLSKIPTQDDGDFTFVSFEQVYQADLANGLGNLVARVAALAEKHNVGLSDKEKKLSPEIVEAMEQYKADQALVFIWNNISSADNYINSKEVWKKTGEEAKNLIGELILRVFKIACDLQPFLPQTASKIISQYSGSVVKRGEILFPRLQ